VRKHQKAYHKEESIVKIQTCPRQDFGQAPGIQQSQQRQKEKTRERIKKENLEKQKTAERQFFVLRLSAEISLRSLFLPAFLAINRSVLRWLERKLGYFNSALRAFPIALDGFARLKTSV